jgi:hypothetical protein
MDQRKAPHALACLPDFCDDFDDVIDMAWGIDAAGNREPDQVHGGFQHLPPAAIQPTVGVQVFRKHVGIAEGPLSGVALLLSEASGVDPALDLGRGFLQGGMRQVAAR